MKRFYVGERIKELRESKKISQLELANLINRRPETVTRWENSPERGITEEDCRKISKALGVTMQELVGGDPSSIGDRPAVAPGYVRVPHLASCPASAGRFMEDEMRKWVEFPKEQVRGRKVYLLDVSGDSMNAARRRPIMDGDTVFVVADQTPKHGDVVVFMIDGACTIKRLQILKDQLVLQPESTNPKHKTIVLNPKQLVLCRGVVESIWQARL